VLTEVKAYSSWQSAPALLLADDGRPETDLIQVTNIDGLEPVKASVGMSPLGSVDGSAYVGSSIPSRNIVLTLHPNPDWDNYTHEVLRRLIYSYFMPKEPTRLVFYSDDLPTVHIDGIVESVEVNLFSNDPEFLVSIICPDPYFTAHTPVTVSGQSVRTGGAVENIDYQGNVEAGIYVKVSFASGAAPTKIGIQVGSPLITFFDVDASVSSTLYFEMSSVPMSKYVHNVNLSTGVITNLLSKVRMKEGSQWPLLQPGESDFSVITDQGVQDWELIYSERFGGL
jgi:phage-related protein